MKDSPGRRDKSPKDLDDVNSLKDLLDKPGNHLESLTGKADSGQYSIRINRQWRICFIWALTKAHTTLKSWTITNFSDSEMKIDDRPYKDGLPPIHPGESLADEH